MKPESRRQPQMELSLDPRLPQTVGFIAGATTVYQVQLIGRHNVKLPGASSDRRKIVSLAREVAESVSLPPGEKPRIGFFGARL